MWIPDENTIDLPGIKKWKLKICITVLWKVCCYYINISKTNLLWEDEV